MGESIAGHEALDATAMTGCMIDPDRVFEFVGFAVPIQRWNGCHARSLHVPGPPMVENSTHTRIESAQRVLRQIGDHVATAGQLLEGTDSEHLHDNLARIEANLQTIVAELGRSDLDGAGPHDEQAPQPTSEGRHGTDASIALREATPRTRTAPSDHGSASAQPAIAFVRGKKTIWAWYAKRQRWVEQRFAAEIQNVIICTGGILVRTEKQAVVFDAPLGRWLSMLDTEPQELVADGAR